MIKQLFTWVRGVAPSYPLLTILLALQQLFAPQRHGLPALLQVFAPYLVLPNAFLLPRALKRGEWGLRAGLLLSLLIYCARFLPRLRSPQPPQRGAGPVVSVLSWNVLYGGNPKKIRDLLITRPAEVVGLVEADGRWIEEDAELKALYPYLLIRKGKPTASMVLLSTFPFAEQIDARALDATQEPLRLLWALLDLGEGRRLRVVVAHPPPPRFWGRNLFATGYHTGERDTSVRQIRAIIDPWVDSGEPLLLMGDFNMTSRDVAYQDMVSGLQDAQRLAGKGLGLTWRLESWRWSPITILRIDYQMCSQALLPLSLRPDCTPRSSDHCPVLGRYEIRQ